MLQIGHFNTLTIIEKSPHGLYLDAGAPQRVLLPNAFVSPSMQIGDDLRVFIYKDSKDRLVATTQQPLAEADQFAYLEVVDVKPGIGVFLDWGLDKHLLLPHREQGDWNFHVGDGAVVAVYVDPYTQRMVASTRLHRHRCAETPDFEPNTPVDLLIYGNSPLGYKAFVNRRYRGLIYHQENSDVLEPGDQFVGYIKKVHSNGKIDLRRDPSGFGRSDQIAEKIFAQLQAAGGQLMLNDHSSPAEIREQFDVSKKAFKQALGRLYKSRRIRFTETGICMTSPDESTCE